MSIPFFAPPEWAWQLVEASTIPPVFVGPLTTATARQLAFPIDAAATAQFTMPGIVDQSGPAPETALVRELATDLYVTRNGRLVFRGRIGTSADTHADGSDTVQFTATDYRGLLDHRIIWPGGTLKFTAMEQSNIAWRLIADTQAQYGGSLNIGQGTGIGTSGITRDRTYTAGVPLGQTIDDLANTENGFEWEIDADLNFNVFHPQRGRDQTASQVLALGHGLTSLVSTVNTDAYANAVFYTGHQPETSPIQMLADFPDDVGRWEMQQSDPNVILQATVSEQARAVLINASQLDPAFTLTMSPAWWEPGDIWLGDLVQVQVDDGRLSGDNAVDVSRRVVDIAITLDDDGTETVVLTANVPTVPIGTTDPPPPPAPGGVGKVPKLSKRLHTVDHRLSKLELVAANAVAPPAGSSVYANIVDYGAIPTTVAGGNIPGGAFDNASALAAAIATGKPAWVPEGIWAISTLSPTTPPGKEIVIEGVGILFAMNGDTQDPLVFGSGQRVTLRGLTFSTWHSTGLHPAISFVGVAWALIEDCNFAPEYIDNAGRGGCQGWVFTGSTNVTFSGCTFDGRLGPNGRLSIRDCTNVNVVGCRFQAAPLDVGAGSVNTFGVNVSGCLFDWSTSTGGAPAQFDGSVGLPNPNFQTIFDFSANMVRGPTGIGSTCIQLNQVSGPFLIASNNLVATASDAIFLPGTCINGRVVGNYGTPDRTF